MLSEGERRIKILEYVRKSSEKDAKITKSDVMRHLKQYSRMMTTHKTVIELIKEGKIKMVKPTDKPYSQIDYLVIDEEDEFNQIYNESFVIETIIDNLIEFYRMIGSDEDEFPDEASTGHLELNAVKPFVERLNSYLADISTKIEDSITSEVDRVILYKRNAELALKIVKGVQSRKFERSMEDLIGDLENEKKKVHKEDSIIKINNLVSSMERYKREFLS